MDVDTYASEYASFIEASPSSFHAAAEAARQLTHAGFSGVDEAAPWPGAPGNYFLVRDGAIVAWAVPESLADGAGFSIWGCHTDSPALKLKPTPDRTTSDGWGQLCVEVYGGALFNSWLDRELILAGVLYDRAGKRHLVRTGPIARVPQLAIHLDRNANQALTLDPQQHLQPIWTVDEPPASILHRLAREAGLAGKDDITGFDLLTATAQGPERFGSHDQFLAAGRQDNLSSVYAGLRAMMAYGADPSSESVTVFAAFDHEEIGSGTRSGAAGPLLEDVLRRTAAALGRDADGVARMIAASTCISADAGHSVHPNYPGVHDPETRPALGRGPLLKINANQRYATGGQGAALWARVCSAAGVSWQSFVSNNAIPCGSTIGPITATRLGILTVDVGIGLLSMHSAREMSHVDDALALSRAAERYFAGRY